LAERLLAEASVPPLRYEQVGPNLGTRAIANSATRLSKIERFSDGHSGCGVAFGGWVCCGDR